MSRMRFKVESKNGNNALDLAKQAFFMAYLACGATSGMGFLQARSNVTADDVLNNVLNRGDYPRPNDKPAGPDYYELYGDYVFGRMMKLGMTVNLANATIEFRDSPADIDYNSWAREYDSVKDLVFTAAALGISLTPAEVPSST